jgi:hypothetical protein
MTRSDHLLRLNTQSIAWRKIMSHWLICGWRLVIRTVKCWRRGTIVFRGMCGGNLQREGCRWCLCLPIDRRKIASYMTNVKALTKQWILQRWLALVTEPHKRSVILLANQSLFKLLLSIRMIQTLLKNCDINSSYKKRKISVWMTTTKRSYRSYEVASSRNYVILRRFSLKTSGCVRDSLNSELSHLPSRTMLCMICVELIRLCIACFNISDNQ